MTINKYTNEKINKHYMIDSLFAENFERSDQKENTNKQQ